MQSQKTVGRETANSSCEITAILDQQSQVAVKLSEECRNTKGLVGRTSGSKLIAATKECQNTAGTRFAQSVRRSGALAVGPTVSSCLRGKWDISPGPAVLAEANRH